MRLFQCLSSARNFNLPKTTKYLQTVFNINFFHENTEITADFLVHSPTQFSTAVLHEVEANVFDFIKRHGFNTQRDLARATGTSNFAVVIPNLSMKHYKLIGNITTAHLFADDIFDRSEFSSPQQIDMAQRMNKIMGEHFRCNALPISDDIRVTFPKFADVCRMYFELGASLLECSNDLQHVYEGFDILVGGNVSQAKLGRAKSAEEYLKRKTDNFGMLFYFDLCCVLAGEKLTPEIRSSAVFKKFQNVTAKMSTICIDPMSVVFDLSEGVNNDNYSAFLTQQGIGIKGAVKGAITRYNQLFVESLMLMSQLDEMNIIESDRRYLHVYLYAIRAALEYARSHKIYNADKSLQYREIQDEGRAADCAVEALLAMRSI